MTMRRLCSRVVAVSVVAEAEAVAVAVAVAVDGALARGPGAGPWRVAGATPRDSNP